MSHIECLDNLLDVDADADTDNLVPLSRHPPRQSSKLAGSSPSVDQPRLIRHVRWLHHIFKDPGIVRPRHLHHHPQGWRVVTH